MVAVSTWLSCSWCCMLLSVWGLVQLVILGILFDTRALALIEEAHAPEGTYSSIDDFIQQTNENYSMIALNCYIAAAMYAFSLILSCMGIVKWKRKETQEKQHMLDDEYVCEKSAERHEEFDKPLKKSKSKSKSPKMKAAKKEKPQLPKEKIAL